MVTLGHWRPGEQKVGIGRGNPLDDFENGVIVLEHHLGDSELEKTGSPLTHNTTRIFAAIQVNITFP